MKQVGTNQRQADLCEFKISLAYKIKFQTPPQKEKTTKNKFETRKGALELKVGGAKLLYSKRKWLL